MAEQKKCTVSFNIVSPFITGNGDAPFAMLDATLPRDDKGHIYFNKSLLRGVFRDAVTSLFKRAPEGLADYDVNETKRLINSIFSSGSGDADKGYDSKSEITAQSYEPNRRFVEFGNLVSSKPFPELQKRNPDLVFTRTARNEVMGSVVEGSLQEIELVASVGQPVEFTSEIIFKKSDDAEACLKLLKLAANAICAIGGNKSSGFGQIKGIPKFSELKTLSSLADATPHIEVAQGMKTGVISLCFKEPFLVSAERVGSNGFVGSDIIPGGAIKAALADIMDLSSDDDKRALTDTIIDHAFPVMAKSDKPIRFSPLPKSLACFGTGKGILNLGEHTGAFVFQDGDVSAPVAMKLESDWKPSEKRAILQKDNELFASEHILPFVPDRTLTVRTAIDSETGAAAMGDDGGKLFSYELVCPTGCDHYDEKTELLWQFRVSAVNEAFFSKLVNTLKSGIHIGKTQAYAYAAKLDEAKSLNVEPLIKSDSSLRYQLVLASDCVMFEATQIENKSGILRKLYEAYFQNAFGDQIRLHSFFAEQKLAGGYVALRYRGGREHYSPWCLTKAGSAFTLEVPLDQQSSFEEKLKNLTDSNLPVSSSVNDAGWEACPYTPENGYGSIVVNPLVPKALPEGVINVGGDNAD